MAVRWLRCCTSRWRKFWTSGVALRGGGFKPPTGALAEDRGVERRGKRRERSRQVRTEKLGDGPGMVPLPLSFRRSVPFREIRFLDGDGVCDFLGVAVAAFGGGPAGCPLASGPVPGQRDDLGDQCLDLAFRAGRTMPAARAAGVGGDVVSDEGEHGGERDELRGGPGFRGGAGGRGRDHVVDEQQAPGFLPRELGRLAAQRAAGTADCRLQVKERDFSRPPLMPVMKESSLALRGLPGRY
jgi:hypothetical protein